MLPYDDPSAGPQPYRNLRDRGEARAKREQSRKSTAGGLMAKVTNNQAKAVSERARAGGPASGGTASPSPEMLEKLGEIRSKLSTAFSQVTMAMMTTPRYRNLSIADLEWLVLEPLLRHRIAIAAARKAEGTRK